MRFATGREKYIGQVRFFNFSDSQIETRTDGIRSSYWQPAADRITAQIKWLSGRRVLGRSNSLGPGKC